MLCMGNYFPQKTISVMYHLVYVLDEIHIKLFPLMYHMSNDNSFLYTLMSTNPSFILIENDWPVLNLSLSKICKDTHDNDVID